jgi:hypothetical protein
MITIDATGLRVKRIRGRTLPQTFMHDFPPYTGTECADAYHQFTVRVRRMMREECRAKRGAA